MDWSVSRERRNLVSARVPSHFNCPLPTVCHHISTVLYLLCAITFQLASTYCVPSHFNWPLTTVCHHISTGLYRWLNRDMSSGSKEIWNNPRKQILFARLMASSRLTYLITSLYNRTVYFNVTALLLLLPLVVLLSNCLVGPQVRSVAVFRLNTCYWCIGTFILSSLRLPSIHTAKFYFVEI